MKKTYLLLFFKHLNKNGNIDGMKIRKNNKHVTLNKSDIKELVVYLKLHPNLWLS